jgi:SAM-dependent methyltransferase
MFYTFLWIPRRPIHEAYNLIFDHAVENDFEFVFLLEEDTIAPAGAWATMINKLKYNPDIFAVTAPYPRKSSIDPTPLFFRGHGHGAYVDWKYGEFFEVTAMPFGCTVLRTSGLEELGKYVGESESINYPSIGFKKTVKDLCKQNVQLVDSDGNEVELQSQDLYFSELARKHGLKMYVDASVKCVHLDINTNIQYVVPQHLHDPNIYLDKDSEKTAINLGCGQQFGPVHGIRPVRVDFREEVNPDLRMDLRDMSGIDTESYDYVYCSHTLEHFREGESKQIVSEMARICKRGGELHITTPNLMGAFKQLAEGKDEPIVWWNIYGESDERWNEHKTGFTPNRIGQWLTEFGLKGKIFFDGKLNLCVRAFKEPLPEWYDEWKGLDTSGWTMDRFFNYELEDPPEPRAIKLGGERIPIDDSVPDEDIEAFFTPSARTPEERKAATEKSLEEEKTNE